MHLYTESTLQSIFSLDVLSGRSPLCSARQPQRGFRSGSSSTLTHASVNGQEQRWCRQSVERESQGGKEGRRGGEGWGSAACYERCFPSPGAKPMDEAAVLLLALPASLTPATVPPVSQQAVDFIVIVCDAFFSFFFLTMCGVCIFFPQTQTVWNVQYSVAYAERLFTGRVLRCRLQWKIHTCCYCQGIFSKEKIS